MFEYRNKENSLILGSVEHVLKRWWLRQICDCNMGWTAEKLISMAGFATIFLLFPEPKTRLWPTKSCSPMRREAELLWPSSDVEVKRTWKTAFSSQYMFMAWCFIYLLTFVTCYMRTYHFCISCGFYSINSFVFVTDKDFVPCDAQPGYLGTT